MKKVNLIALLATLMVPAMAFAEPQQEPQPDTKIIKFVKAVGLPASISQIKAGSTIIAIVWNYPHSMNGKDMYILLQDGLPKTVTIGGKMAMSSLDG